MILAKYTKQPAERKRYRIRYTEWLDAGELISTAEFAVSPLGGMEIDSWELDVSATGVIFFASGGSSGVTYKVTATITTDGGQIKEDELTFTVRDT